MKCANGKWKYGESGKCVFDTLAACKAAAAAIHIDTPSGPHQADKSMVPVDPMIVQTPCDCIGEDVHSMLLDQYK